MNCKRFARLAPLYLYGEAAEGLRGAVEEHAASCPACREALAATASTIAWARKHPPHFSPEEISALRVRVLAETARIALAPPPVRPRLLFAPFLANPVFRFVPVAAAAAVVVWLLLPRSPEVTTEPAELAVTGVLAMADDIEEESREVAEVCREIDDLNAKLAPLKSFVLPGGTAASAYLHLARTVLRRAERDMTQLMTREEINPAALKYANRLSDLLFVLARHCNARGKRDVLWVPGANR